MIPILADAVRWLTHIITGMLLISVLLSWMPVFRGGIVSFIHAFTEPILGPIRRLIERSPLGGPGLMLDFSPIIAIVMIRFVSNVLISLLMGLA